MTVHLRTTPDADEQAEQADAWWQANRPAAPGLFLQELTNAFEMVGFAPDVGAPYSHPRIARVRRLVLPKTRYCVYYRHDTAAQEIVILAVWSSLRGQPPPLRAR